MDFDDLARRIRESRAIAAAEAIIDEKHRQSYEHEFVVPLPEDSD